MKTISNTRRLFIAAGAGLAVAAAVPSWAQQPIELKVSTFVPPNHTINIELLRWSTDLEKKSNGQLKVQVFSSSQMGPITRQYDLARTGVADVAWCLLGATPGRFPLSDLSTLPYAFNPERGGALHKPLSGADASAVLTALTSATPEITKEFEGTRVLYQVVAPTIGLFFNKATVHAPVDMKGMRIRHNGPLSAKIIEAWGATPAAVAPVELADALQKGTVDGMTFNYEIADSLQIASAVKSVTEVNAYATTFALVMNQKKYESLPADLRKLIDDSSGVDAARRVGARFDVAEASGKRYMVDNKVVIIAPTAVEQQAFKKPLAPLTDEVIKAAEAKGLPARKVYDDLRARVNGVGAK